MRSLKAWIFAIGAILLLAPVSAGCLGEPECTGCSNTDAGGGIGKTAGSGGTTSAGGTGGTLPCISDQDCQPHTAPPCMKPVCSSGACAEAPDNSLSPTDDGNPCTTDTCVNGVETYGKNTDPCGSNPPTTHCEGGVCIGCMVDADCDPKTECQVWSCSPEHQCVPTNGPTDLFIDDVGNCTLWSCSDMGVLVLAEDLKDVPADDGNGCTKAECLGLGRPSNTPQEGQSCGTGPTCAEGVEKAQGICDAIGGCKTASMDCAPFACDVTACKTSCAAPADCASAAYCDAGESMCFDKKANGTGCGTQNECFSSFCSADDQVCCASACSTACRSCYAGGMAGTCGKLAKGVKDKCASGMVCSDSGSCAGLGSKKAVGEVCAVANSDCFNYVAGGKEECVNGLCRLHVGEVCESSSPHECETNLCDAFTHTCQECIANADCPDMVCDIPNKRCLLAAGGVCGASADCSPGHACTNNVCQ